MCGIVSIFNQQKQFDLKIKNTLKQLISVNTLRGDDSTGLIYESKGEVQTYKKVLTGHDFVNDPHVDRILRDWEQSSYIIAHNRAGTKGSVSIQNAHPFQHGAITGVHNGTLYSYQGLHKSYFGTDSEHVFAALDEAKDTEEIISKLQGSYVLIWHNYYDNCIHLIRNDTRPYHLAQVKDKKIVLGASEADMLKWIAKRNDITLERVFIPKPGTEYIFDPEADITKPVSYKRKTYQTSKYNNNTSNYPHNTSTNSSYNNNKNLQGKEIPFTPNKTINFYFTEFIPHNVVHERPKKSVSYGQFVGFDDEKVGVNCYHARQDEFKLQTWYEGSCTHKNKSTKELVINANTIKKSKKETTSPVKEGSKEGPKLLCCNCRSVLSEEIVVFVDSTPLCIDCATHFDVEFDKQINLSRLDKNGKHGTH